MDIEKDLAESIREQKKMFPKLHSKKTTFYFENLKGKERKEYMGETNLKVYTVEEKEVEDTAKNLTYKEFLLKPLDMQKKIFAKWQEWWKSDRGIAKHVMCASSSIWHYRQKNKIQVHEELQGYTKENNEVKEEPKQEVSKAKEPKPINISYKIENATVEDISNTVTYITKILEQTQTYDFSFEIKSYSPKTTGRDVE